MSPIYVFFKPLPSVEIIRDRRVHVFECTVLNCKGRANGRMVRRYLNTADAKSTSNLRKHAKICWGAEAVAAADATNDISAARAAMKTEISVILQLLPPFKESRRKTLVTVIVSTPQSRPGKSYHLHFLANLTCIFHSAEIVRWVAESKRPFQIVNDH